MTDHTLTKRQRRVYDHVPAHWQSMNMNPRDRIIAQLERRGLVEVRIDPSIETLDATQREILGQHGHWQIRRKV